MATSRIEELLEKALSIGNYNAAPDTLTQQAAASVEDVSPIMHNVTFEDKHIKLQKEVKVSKAKGQLVQFMRTLAYGGVGGSAQLEGTAGQEETSDIVRSVVPMAYYSHVRRVTMAADMAETQDGVKAEDREAKAAALKLAMDIEIDLFRGKDDFSNAGVFDGNPLAIPNTLPGMLGLGVQIRQSDNQDNTKDLMFDSFGSNLSNVIAGGGTLSQGMIEDAWIRGVMNFGSGDRMFVDPLVLSAYSKAAYANKERIILGNSASEPVTGADIRKQAVSGGVVSLEASRFLSMQTKPKRSRSGSPSAPTIATGGAAGTTSFTAGQVYTYYVTAENELGESVASSSATRTIATNGDSTTVTITKVGSNVRFYNVFRSNAGGSATSARLIGKVKDSGNATTIFTDLNNRLPGGISGFLVQMDTMEIKELAPYSRLKLAQVQLDKPEAHFRFLCEVVYEPRKNIIVDSLTGSL